MVLCGHSVYFHQLDNHWTILLCVLSCFSCVQLFATPWTVAHQVPLSMGFSKQQFWIVLPCPPPGDLPDPEIEPVSPALSGGFFTTEPPRKPHSLDLQRN